MTRWRSTADRRNGFDRPIDRFAELRASLHNACIAKVGPELHRRPTATPTTLKARVREVVLEELGRQAERLTADERAQLVEDVVDDVLGYGPIDRFVRDRSVTEIMVNGPDQVWVERGGLIEQTDVRFAERRARDARHRPDRVRCRPPDRRSVADGRRAPRRRLPRERDHPAALARRGRC